MSEAILNFFKNKANIIYFLLNREGKILESNKYTESLLGNNLYGENIKKYIIDFTNTLSINNLLAGNTEGILLSLDTAGNLPETYVFYFEPSEKTIEAFGLINKAEDHFIQEEIIKLNNELNILMRKLHKQNAELEKLNNLKNRSIGIASHDLRNPLGAIVSFSYILMDQLSGTITSRQLDFLNNISNLGNSGINLLNKLLDISQIESGKLQLNIAPCNINELIRESILINQHNASKKNIHIAFVENSRSKNVLIEIDKVSILQVINNLLSNAIKFSKNDTSINIGIKMTKDKLTFFIQDQGQGIPKNEMDKLFKPFSKTSTKPIGEEKSSGLGLAITKMIIESHHGEIWAVSEENRGATFYFSIPLTQEQYGKR